MESTVIPANVEAQRRGQHYALVLAVAVLLTGVLFMLKGYAKEGAVVITADLVALATVFLAGRDKEKTEIDRKRDRDR